MTKITLTVQETADMLGLSKNTVYTMARKNEIPHFKARGRVLFNREVVEAWTKGEVKQVQHI